MIVGEKVVAFPVGIADGKMAVSLVEAGIAAPYRAETAVGMKASCRVVMGKADSYPARWAVGKVVAYPAAPAAEKVAAYPSCPAPAYRRVADPDQAYRAAWRPASPALGIRRVAGMNRDRRVFRPSPAVCPDAETASAEPRLSSWVSSVSELITGRE